jgi:hypothetical protein
MSTFFETTWFLWWLIALAIAAWWSWRTFADDQGRPYKPSAHWKRLYRQALVERDEGKLGIRIQEAEGAILLELATQVFRRDDTKRTALQEALNNLDRLRGSPSQTSDETRVA